MLTSITAACCPNWSKLVFNGKIYCTEPTQDLLGFMLRDSAFIQESNVERINEKRERRGERPIKPVYTIKDAEATIPLVRVGRLRNLV